MNGRAAELVACSTGLGMHAIVSSFAGERVKLIRVKHPAECRDDGDTIRERERG